MRPFTHLSAFHPQSQRHKKTSFRLSDFVGEFISLLVISSALTFLAIMPAVSPRHADAETEAAVSGYVTKLLPPGTYYGIDRYGGRCQVESRGNQLIRIQSGGYDFSLEGRDLSFVEDISTSGSELHFTLRDGGLKWCGQAPSLPCWQEAKLHKTIWMGQEGPSGAPFITVLDRFADKAECYGLKKTL